MNDTHALCTVETPWGEPVALSWQNITLLALTSERIVAGDPFDTENLSRTAFLILDSRFSILVSQFSIRLV